MEKESLAQFVKRSLADLDAMEASLRTQLSKVLAQKEQLKRAASIADEVVAPTQSGGLPLVSRRPRRLKGMTLKEAIVEILNQRGHGLTASEILMELNNRHGTDFARESLSPQISRLRQEGHLELTDRIWHLKNQPISLAPLVDQSKNLWEDDI
jgi:glucose-6-phosphate-specific signal transduction histidine kinase